MRYAARLVLRGGHPHEAAAVTEVLAEAFAGGDVDRWLGATTETRIAYFRTVVDAALAGGIVRVAEADGVLIGAALWFPHAAVSLPTPSAGPAAPVPDLAPGPGAAALGLTPGRRAAAPATRGEAAEPGSAFSAGRVAEALSAMEPTLVLAGGSAAAITTAPQPRPVGEHSRTAGHGRPARQVDSVGDDGPTSFAGPERSIAPQPDLDRLVMLERLLAERRPIRTAHHHLAYLGVRPEQQGQGIGTYLLIGHHAFLHVLRVPAYLEANDQRNRALYLRHGYTDLGTPILLPGGIPIWPMWRPPKPAGPVPRGLTPGVAFLSYQ